MALVIILIKQIKVLLVVNIRSFSRVQFLSSSASSHPKNLTYKMPSIFRLLLKYCKSQRNFFAV